MTEQELNELLNEAFQAKVWMDVNRHFMKMSEDEQSKILNEFEHIAETYGENSAEMAYFFHSSCMKYSKLYYFVQTTQSENNNWDEALEKELLS